MTTFFRNKLEAEIGTSEVLILSTNSGTRATIIGLSLTNLTSGIVLASIRLEDVSASPATAYYVKEVIVPPNQSLRVVNGGEKLIIGPEMEVYVQSNSAASLDLVMSYVEIV